jgi:phage I-like protein
LLAKHVQPFIDFDHEGKASAANPKGFRWVTGKGVYLALEWTKGGRERVEGKDYRYFSPTFHVGPDGEPNGLPESGAIGALTNNPAFRDIQRIAASRTKAAANGDDDGATKPNKPLNQVSQEIKDNLAKLGLISKDDARIEDPVRRMAEQKRVIAHFRSTHPDMRTEEVFRQLTRLNPKFFKD